MTGPYVWNLIGDRYHTTDCPAVTAYDALTRLAVRKSDVPAGRQHCGHCKRSEAR